MISDVLASIFTPSASIAKIDCFLYNRRMSENYTHWADLTALKVIREKGEKDVYVCASGITPSGTVHIGNFREIISVALVARALAEMGRKVRFIYSWDDYDVFRKVPANMPDREKLETYLRKPITLVPDPFGKAENYARANEIPLEELLPEVGINPEYLYQAERYRDSKYAAGIRTALEKRDQVRRILDEHRTSSLPEDWYPVSVFCGKCDRDTTRVYSWNGDWEISYSCSSCGNDEAIDLRSTSLAKLPWRIDWPMRWDAEQVDFEPAGKDHHSEGGSFDTGRKIVKEIYGTEAPVTFQYDFLSIKGRGGKISSSTGEVVSLPDVLEIYQPEVTRYLFAGTRPNVEFAISFDLDVIKIYEDYDKCERIYFGAEEVGEKRREKEKRIYELSQVGSVPDHIPVQIPFRHLCNLLQIYGGDVASVKTRFGPLTSEQERRLEVRARCAWNWITQFAPEDFRFALRDSGEPAAETDSREKEALKNLRAEVVALEKHDEKSLAEAIYAIAEKAGLEPKDFFRTVYRALIKKDQGPRLAGFILTAGKEKVLPLL